MALPGRGPADAAPFFVVGFMKSKDEQEHMELERDTYSKVWAERAKAGQIWNWSIWSRHSGQGHYEQNPRYNMVSVVAFPKGAEGPRMGGSGSSAAQAAFPDDTPEQLRARLGRANQVRDMAGFEVWTVVDATGLRRLSRVIRGCSCSRRPARLGVKSSGQS